MNYLIGGLPRCGKTNLAEAVAKKTSLSYFSLAYFRTVAEHSVGAFDGAHRGLTA
jgi:cytidylate kinase